jgi:hypothetical protein
VRQAGRELPQISGLAMGFRTLLYGNTRQGGPSEKTEQPVSGLKESPWGPLSGEILWKHRKTFFSLYTKLDVIDYKKEYNVSFSHVSEEAFEFSTTSSIFA